MHLQRRCAADMLCKDRCILHEPLAPLRGARRGRANYCYYVPVCTCRRSADRRRVYVATPEEREADAAEARKSAVLAAGVVLGPVLMMGAMLIK